MRTQISQRLALLLVIIVAMTLRLYHVDFQSLWRDEVDTLRFATRPLPDLARNLLEPGENGPLYFIALRPWLAVAGPAEFALRFPSVCAGTLAIPAIYILAKRLAGTSAALVAALLAATAPYLVWYGQEAKMYSTLALLLPLSLWWTTEVVRRGGLWRWAVLYAVTSLALYTHILAAFVIPVQVLWLVLWPAHQSEWRRWVAPGLYLIALILPYMPLARWQVPYWTSAAQSGRALSSLPNLLGVLGSGFGHGVLPVRSTWQLLPAFLGLLSGIFLWVTPPDELESEDGPKGRRAVLLLLIWLLIPIFLLILVSPGLPVVAERYLIWIMPSFLILVALGAISLSKLWRLVGLGLLAVILALNLAALASQSTLLIKSDFRGAARFVAAYKRPGDLLLFQIPYSRYAFTYYDATQSSAATSGCLPAAELWFTSECGRGNYESPTYVEGPYTNAGADEATVASGLEQALDGTEGVWLVASEEPLWDARGLTRGWLDANGSRTDHADFTRVSVTRYNLAP